MKDRDLKQGYITDDNDLESFVKAVSETILYRLEEIESEVDWNKILNLDDEEIKSEALRLKEDLASIKRIINDL